MFSSLILAFAFLFLQDDWALAQTQSDEAAPKQTSAKSSPPTPGPSALNFVISASFDCTHNFNVDKGKSQNCLNVNHLSLLAEKHFERVYGSVVFNPFGTPVASFENRPRIDSFPTNDELNLGIIDDYRIVWSPRPHLEIGIESFSGSALFPTISPLAMANPFMETGWKQTALTATYNLLALPEMRVKFATGNGEGENGKNLDTQQFFGFDISALLVKGIKTHLGISLDGNSTGSEENRWKKQVYEKECGISVDKEISDAKMSGYSTQRISLGMIVNGIWPGSEGMKLGLGYQRNIMSDLNRKQNSQVSPENLGKCPRLDLNSIFVENTSENVVNTVQKTVYNLDLVYAGSSYFVAANYSQREVDTGSVKLFDSCSRIENYRCIESEGAPTNNIKIDSFTAGAGIYLTKTSVFSLEYQIQNYDKLYNLANFEDRSKSISKSRDIFDARYSVALP